MSCNIDLVDRDRAIFRSIAVWYIIRAIPLAIMTSTPVPSRQRNTSSYAACEFRIRSEALASGEEMMVGSASSGSCSNTPAVTACNCKSHAGVTFNPYRSRKSLSISAALWASEIELDSFSCAIRDLKEVSSSSSPVVVDGSVGSEMSVLCSNFVFAAHQSIMREVRYEALMCRVSFSNKRKPGWVAHTAVPKCRYSWAIRSVVQRANIDTTAALFLKADPPPLQILGWSSCAG